MLRSLEQERAKYAMDYIREVKGKNFQKDYKSYVKGAPILILTNGLGNALAFIKSKKEKEAYNLLYTHLNKWLEERKVISKKDILEWIIDNDTTSILVHRATDEVLALLNWMKRFADVELEG